MEKGKLKEKEILNEEQNEIKTFITVLVSIIVIILAVFLFTKYVINDGDVRLPLVESTVGTVNNNVVTVGTMLGKNDDHYYVIAFATEDKDSSIYEGIVSGYKNTIEETLNVYHLDLSNELNKDYLATEENPENTNAKKISKLAFGKITLLEIVDNKISSYITDLEEIREILAFIES